MSEIYRTTTHNLQIHEEKLRMPPVYQNQYYHLYMHRLDNLKAFILESADYSWGDMPMIDIIDIKRKTECATSGLLIRKYEGRGSIIEQYGTRLQRKVESGRIATQEDKFYLEDEQGSIQLSFKSTPEAFRRLPHGCVVAVRGYCQENSVFKVIDFCLPSLHPISPPSQDERLLVFISGLELGCGKYNPLLIPTLIDYLTGGLSPENRCLADRIARIVLLGNQIYTPPMCKKVIRNNIIEEVQGGEELVVGRAQQMDAILAQLAIHHYIDVLPGPSDPATEALPQQPLNSILFPLCRNFESVKHHTNPAFYDIDDIRMICTSGQNLQALRESVMIEDSMMLMTLNIDIAHLAPMAPDLCPMPPLAYDPLVLRKIPHFYVVGNQPRFDTKVYRGCRLISVPKFSDQRHFVVFADLAGMNAWQVEFVDKTV